MLAPIYFLHWKMILKELWLHILGKEAPLLSFLKVRQVYILFIICIASILMILSQNLDKKWMPPGVLL